MNCYLVKDPVINTFIVAQDNATEWLSHMQKYGYHPMPENHIIDGKVYVVMIRVLPMNEIEKIDPLPILPLACDFNAVVDTQFNSSRI